MTKQGLYTYFISSLPALYFDMKLPFSFDEFLKRAEDLISDDGIGALRKLADIRNLTEGTDNRTIRDFSAFEITLRNELAKIRASRKHMDENEHIKEGGYFDAAINQLAINAHKSASVPEGEKMIDEARWQKLDELSMGHYFDFDALAIYAVKLLILEKWNNVKKANSGKLVEETLARGE